MKNKISVSCRTQFPNIYRFITENKFLKHVLKLEFKLLNQPKHKKALTYFLSYIIFFAMLNQ